MSPPDQTTLPSNCDDASTLRVQNEALRNQVDTLQEQLAALKAELEAARGLTATAADTIAPTPADAPRRASCGPCGGDPSTSAPTAPPAHPPRAPPRHGLSRAQAERYSRHLLLPAFGVAAQERLCRGSVLIVGCGGLGSPAAMYLAAAGVGRLGLVDHDSVDVSNLHRQVMHSTARVGMHKALSGRLTCAAINPTVQVEAHVCGLSPASALALVDGYDVVIDASDNPATRYLVSDACVVAGKPLVSAAAVGTDGQLTVYNHGPDGPCYRCLFPESPSPENCSRCGEAGVLGVVPGVMGCLQALEAIKLLSGVGEVASKKLTLFDALSGRFTTVRLRGRSPGCVACGASPALTRASLPDYDYVLFTGQPPDDGPPPDLQLLDAAARLAPAEVAALLAAEANGAEANGAAAADGAAEAVAEAGEQGPEAGAKRGEDEARAGAESSTGSAGPAGPGPRRGVLLLDVRPQAQYDVMALPGAVHVPFERLDERLGEVLALCGAPAGSTPAGSSAAESSAANSAPTSASAAEAAPQGAAVDAPEAAAAGAGNHPPPRPRVVVLCRRGNNSQRVAARLAALGVEGVTDMVGGYQAWARQVDPAMPLL